MKKDPCLTILLYQRKPFSTKSGQQRTSGGKKNTSLAKQKCKRKKLDRIKYLTK